MVCAPAPSFAKPLLLHKIWCAGPTCNCRGSYCKRTKTIDSSFCECNPIQTFWASSPRDRVLMGGANRCFVSLGWWAVVCCWSDQALLRFGHPKHGRSEPCSVVKWEPGREPWDKRHCAVQTSNRPHIYWATEQRGRRAVDHRNAGSGPCGHHPPGTSSGNRDGSATHSPVSPVHNRDNTTRGAPEETHIINPKQTSLATASPTHKASHNLSSPRRPP